MVVFYYGMAKTFFTAEAQQRIVEAIRLAELNTSGEIRVHVEPTCAADPYQRALEVFEELKMHETALRNGVLFYVAYESKKFAILGDQGIHEKVSQEFWDAEKELMLTHFKSGQYAEGLMLAIEEAGKKLKAYFPYASDDTNELTNDISFGGGQDA